MKLNSYYFEQAGPQNTDQTLEIAHERAVALGIRQMVVASSHGDTARKAQALCKSDGIRIIAVTICHGWEKAGWCMPTGTQVELQSLGITVVTGVHALGDGVSSAFNEKSGGRSTEEIVRDTLYRFSQGMKVAVECVLMAADAGLLDMGQEVVSVAGTGNGADTAIVCKPAYPRTFLEFEIREILAKPRVP